VIEKLGHSQRMREVTEFGVEGSLHVVFVFPADGLDESVAVAGLAVVQVNRMQHTIYIKNNSGMLDV
jgi:hypothetical protein